MMTLLTLLGLSCLIGVGLGLSLNFALQRRLIRRFLLVDALEPRFMAAQQLLNRQVTLKQLAHDLASPLMALELTVPVLDWPVSRERSAASLANEWRRAVSDWQKISTQAVELCQNYLQADLQTNRLIDQPSTPSVAELPLIDLVNQAIESVTPLALKKHLTIKLDLTDELSNSLLIDEVAGQRVIVNLLTNAIKASLTRDEVRLELRPVNGAYRLKVINTGESIAWPEIISWVEHSRATVVGQHGHGLASAFRLSEDLGWRLHLMPRSSGGLEATLVIPCSSLGKQTF